MSGKNSVFDIVFSVQAQRQFKALERQIAERIKNAIEAHLRTLPPTGDVIKLEGRQGEFRLRVGDWRVTFRYRIAEREVHISEVKHRSKAYK